MDNITLRHISVTTVAVERQEVFNIKYVFVFLP